jgi:hypothetical protein
MDTIELAVGPAKLLGENTNKIKKSRRNFDIMTS